MKGSKIKNGGAVYVGSYLTVYNILRFLLANRDSATFLSVNKIKIVGMLMNIVHHLVY